MEKVENGLHEAIMVAVREYQGLFGSCGIRTSRPWQEISKQLGSKIQSKVDVKKHLEDLKSKLIEKANAEPAFETRKELFVRLGKDILPFFDYVEPLDVRKSSYGVSEDEPAEKEETPDWFKRFKKKLKVQAARVEECLEVHKSALELDAKRLRLLNSLLERLDEK